MTLTTSVADSPPKSTFVLWWVLASTISFAMVGALFHNFPLAIRFPTIGLDGMELDYAPAIVGAVLGAVSGVFIGVLQWITLRRYLPISRWWIVSTTVGVGLLHFLSDGFPDAADLTVAVIASAVVVGLLQSYLLRRHLPMTVWWILASVGWDVGWVIGLATVDATGLLNVPWTPVVGLQQHGLLGMVMGLVYSLFTGVILVGLRWRKAITLTQRFADFAKTVLVANTLSGIVVGALARLAMTMVTWAGGYSLNFPVNEFTLAGTLRVILTPIVFGIPFAALLVRLRGFIPGTGWRKLLAYGCITLVFPGLPALTDSSFHLNWATQYVGVATFAPIYFLYGLLIGVVVERLDRRAPVAAKAS